MEDEEWIEESLRVRKQNAEQIGEFYREFDERRFRRSVEYGSRLHGVMNKEGQWTGFLANDMRGASGRASHRFAAKIAMILNIESGYRNQYIWTYSKCVESLDMEELPRKERLRIRSHLLDLAMYTMLLYEATFDRPISDKLQGSMKKDGWSK